jgi:two-component system LytT family sensor kinase
MKIFLTRPTRFEWQSYLFLMPFFGFVLNYMLYGNGVFTRTDVWLYSYPVLLVNGFFSWYLHIAVMHWLRECFPSMKRILLRLGLLALAHLALISLTFINLFYWYDHFHFLGYEMNSADLETVLYIGIGITFTSTPMWEAEYTFRQWKNSIAEKEKMEQLTIEHEFETLKSQVNPHFLFNCFNTLSSLISEDKKQAEVFLNELSKVYRYLLKNNEDGLSTLQTEIKFVASYYKLLQTRHGEAIQLNIETDSKYDDMLLPSLSLQLLIENAVKHNVLSKSNPLVIDIFTTSGNQLVISNNLQLRTQKAPSNKIGLENIRNKYALLKETGFQILRDKKTFTVALPLLKNKKTERKISLQAKTSI